MKVTKKQLKKIIQESLGTKQLLNEAAVPLVIAGVVIVGSFAAGVYNKRRFINAIKSLPVSLYRCERC